MALRRTHGVLSVWSAEGICPRQVQDDIVRLFSIQSERSCALQVFSIHGCTWCLFTNDTEMKYYRKSADALIFWFGRFPTPHSFQRTISDSLTATTTQWLIVAPDCSSESIHTEPLCLHENVFVYTKFFWGIQHLQGSSYCTMWSRRPTSTAASISSVEGSSFVDLNRVA